MGNIYLSNTELGEKNVFEQLFSLIERHRISYENDFKLDDFYEIVSNFDNAFQNFNTENTNENIVIEYNQLLNTTFNFFIKIFEKKGFNDEPIYHGFKKFIFFFTFLLSEANELKNEKDISRNIYENFPSFYIDINEDEFSNTRFYFSNDTHMSRYLNKDSSIHLFELKFIQEIGIDESDFNEYIIRLKDNFYTEIKIVTQDENEETNETDLNKNIEKSFVVYCNNFIAKTISWDDKIKKYNILNEQHYMFIDIEINSEVTSLKNLISPLWLIVSALENINGVTLELDDIKKGSLKLRIKVWMNELLAKEETKAVLEAAKEIAVSKLSDGNVSYQEIKKSKHEIKNLELENTKLESEIENLPNKEEILFERALDIQKKMLENEKVEIENVKAKLEIIDKLSDLASKGIIEADMIRIDINDLLYILTEKKEIKEIGPDINEIT